VSSKVTKGLNCVVMTDKSINATKPQLPSTNYQVVSRDSGRKSRE